MEEERQKSQNDEFQEVLKNAATILNSASENVFRIQKRVNEIDKQVTDLLNSKIPYITKIFYLSNVINSASFVILDTGDKNFAYQMKSVIMQALPMLIPEDNPEVLDKQSEKIGTIVDQIESLIQHATNTFQDKGRQK
jgi:hypothetical protein